MTCDTLVTELPEGTPVVPLSDAVRSALDGTGRTWLRRVSVSVYGGVVLLQGRVPSFYLKQMAQVIVMAVPGVGVVRNELQVEGDR